jgi:hypothetical protein
MNRNIIVLNTLLHRQLNISIIITELIETFAKLNKCRHTGGNRYPEMLESTEFRIARPSGDLPK